MSQTKYNTISYKALPGLIADSTIKHDIFGASNIGEGGPIAFGSFVMKTSNAGFVSNPSSDDEEPIAGVVVRSLARQGNSLFDNEQALLLLGLNTNAVVLPFQLCDVMRRGSVWVRADKEMSVGDTLFIRHSTNGRVITITFSADFVASNTIDMDIAGSPLTQQTYASSHSATFGAVVNAIQSDFVAGIGVLDSVTGDATARTITMIGNSKSTGDEFTNYEVENIVVSGGASQATAVAVVNQEAYDFSKGSVSNDDLYGSAFEYTGGGILIEGDNETLANGQKITKLTLNLPE